MAKNSKRRAWKSEDVRTLKTLAKKKTRAASIARTLKRTEGATRQKAFSLGLSLNFAFLNLLAIRPAGVFLRAIVFSSRTSVDV